MFQCCSRIRQQGVPGQEQLEHDEAQLGALFDRALVAKKRAKSGDLERAQFIELKTTHEAIEAYRRAVDVSPRDYRAWYGLGQTYEILNMYFYALYYYRKAALLRPLAAALLAACAPPDGAGMISRTFNCHPSTNEEIGGHVRAYQTTRS